MTDNIGATLVEHDPEDEREGEYTPPLLSDRGCILVEVVDVDLKEQAYLSRFTIENTQYDTESSVFWIVEEVGIQYWMEQRLDETHVPGPGWYVIEGIYGTFYKGDWGYTEDEIEWEFDTVRPATPEEILNGLGPKPS